MKIITWYKPLLGFGLLFSALHAGATPITFTGEDINAGPGSAHPNSSAAAASFAASASTLGTVSVITFESAPVGSYTSLSVAPGVTLTGSNYQGSAQAIMNTPAFPSAPSLDGFNTTPGGSNYAEELGGSLTFTFANPTQFFGAYVTGVQSAFYQDVFTFNDGSVETIDVPESGTNSSIGALDFVGFTDPGKAITSVTIQAGTLNTGADFIGIDDVMYQAVTPEPSSIALLGTGLLGALGMMRKRFA